VGAVLIVVQAGGVAIMRLGMAGAVVTGEAGGEEQAVRTMRSKKLALSTVEVEEEHLRMSIRFVIL
jgi:predicted glycosyltransferase